LNLFVEVLDDLCYMVFYVLMFRIKTIHIYMSRNNDDDEKVKNQLNDLWLKKVTFMIFYSLFSGSQCILDTFQNDTKSMEF
jgi:hypothetical protein